MLLLNYIILRFFCNIYESSLCISCIADIKNPAIKPD